MNCINHPDVPVAAYCQNCGKALCQECVRSVEGVIYCESCLSARLNTPGGIPGSGVKPPFVGLPPVDGPNPGLALGLGFIPGVGAMYNGQFVKGTVHVLVFALLCSAAAHSDFFGWLIPFWIAYQVFDAYQTAKARRDGTPLPNPFGLNDLGYRLGLQAHPETPAAAPFTPFAGVPFSGPQGPSGVGGPGVATPGTGTPYTTTPPYAPVGESGSQYGAPASGFVSGFGNPAAPNFDPASAPPPGTGVPPPAYSPARPASSTVPVGAIILIGLGTLFLLSSMGVFRDEWIGRAWPLILVGIGIWLIVKRTRETPGGNGL